MDEMDKNIKEETGPEPEVSGESAVKNGVGEPGHQEAESARVAPGDQGGEEPAEAPTETGPEDGSGEVASDAGDDDTGISGELAAARAEVEDLRDRLMRALAEVDNTRKRGERIRRDAEVYGGRRLAMDLLSVFDNMNRALSAVDDTQREVAGGLIEGIELTKRDLVEAFSRNGIVPVEPTVGEKFDPKQHSAVFNAPNPDVPAGCIATVLREGFVMADRLLRPAEVGVSSGTPKT